jgi:hypothetical protein
VTKQNLKDRAARRIPKHKLVTLNVSEPPALPRRVADAAPENAYHYAWLSALLERVIAQVSAECAEQGMKTHWDLFQARVVQPILGRQSAPSLSDLCQAQGVKDTKTASNMIITVKRHFRGALLEHVRRTVLAKDQALDELEELLQFFPKSAQHLQ